MKLASVIVAGTLMLSFAPSVFAQDSHPKVWKENTDGSDLKPDEYRKISEDGGTTRRPCPYTCEERGVPTDKCRVWKSKDGQFCYVQDLRLPEQRAVPLGK